MLTLVIPSHTGNTMKDAEASVKFSISIPGDELRQMDANRGTIGRSPFIAELVRESNRLHRAKNNLYTKVDEAVDAGLDVIGLLNDQLKKEALDA